MSGDNDQRDGDRQDREAKLERLHRYRPAVLAYMRRRGFPPEEAQDLTQQVFLRVCQNVDAYRGQAAWGYLETVAKSVALNAIRDRHAIKREGIEEPEETAAAIPDRRDIPADVQLEVKERSRRLWEAVGKLELPLRACVVRYLAGDSYEEIAAAMHLRVSTVKSRLHAARQRLQELMGVDFEGMGGEG